MALIQKTLLKEDNVFEHEFEHRTVTVPNYKLSETLVEETNDLLRTWEAVSVGQAMPVVIDGILNYTVTLTGSNYR